MPQVIVRSEGSDEVESADEGETSRMFGAKSRRKRKPKGSSWQPRAHDRRRSGSPESPVTGQAIQCTYTDFRDPDGDPDDSLVDWTVNGKDAGFGPTLEEGFVKGDKVRCTVTPHDGAVGGPKKYAQVIVRNTNPTIRSAKITPEAPMSDTLQVCLRHFADPDGDPDRSSIVWTVNGLRRRRPRPQDQARVGRPHRVPVTPRDGEGSGDPVRAAVAGQPSAEHHRSGSSPSRRAPVSPSRASTAATAIRTSTDARRSPDRQRPAGGHGPKVEKGCGDDSVHRHPQRR